MKHTGLALGIVAMLFAGTVSAKEYFKWVDDQGVTHFTTSPPKDRPSETVNTYGGSSTKYDPNAAVAGTEEGKAEKEQLEKTKEKEVQAATQKAEKCKKVADQQKYLIDRAGSRVRMQDREGNEKVLSPEEQQAEIDKMQKFIDEHCVEKAEDTKKSEEKK